MCLLNFISLLDSVDSLSPSKIARTKYSSFLTHFNKCRTLLILACSKYLTIPNTTNIFRIKIFASKKLIHRCIVHIDVETFRASKFISNMNLVDKYAQMPKHDMRNRKRLSVAISNETKYSITLYILNIVSEFGRCLDSGGNVMYKALLHLDSVTESLQDIWSLSKKKNAP